MLLLIIFPILFAGLSAQCDIFGMEFFYESCLYDFCADPLNFSYLCDIIQQFDEVCGANFGLTTSPPCGKS